MLDVKSFFNSHLLDTAKINSTYKSSGTYNDALISRVKLLRGTYSKETVSRKSIYNLFGIYGCINAARGIQKTVDNIVKSMESTNSEQECWTYSHGVFRILSR